MTSNKEIQRDLEIKEDVDEITTPHTLSGNLWYVNGNHRPTQAQALARKLDEYIHRRTLQMTSNKEIERDLEIKVVTLTSLSNGELELLCLGKLLPCLSWSLSD
jgi:hypothetical protein